MSGEEIRQLADRLRTVPLPEVLRLWEARSDCRDRSKWHTSRGTLSVNGAKFFNWHCHTGGGGAIDLVIHLMGEEGGFRQALHWLQTHFDHGSRPPLPPPLRREPSHPRRRVLSMPASDRTRLHRVRSYLVKHRALPPALLDELIASGRVYADGRANAVFVLLGSDGLAVGAELRGTNSVHWRGMARGSHKDHGYFSVGPGPAGQERRQNRCPIILCESAIDAISCLTLHPGHRCLSTSGACANPAWLPALITQHQDAPIYCGFDADDTGDHMARAMMAMHPEIKRLRPERHDWNDLLRWQPGKRRS